MQSFEDFLFEQQLTDNGTIKYVIPKDVQTIKQVHEVTECLIAAFAHLMQCPTSFNISKRPENIKTIQHILKDPNASRSDVKTKVKIINFITKLDLNASFSKSAKNDKDSSGMQNWIYIFIVKNAIEPFETMGFNKNGKKLHKGTSLYLKICFSTYEDTETTIKVDPKTICLDVISIHPTK